MAKIEYVRQQGPDCVVSRDGKRHIVSNCDANKLGNTLYNRLGPKYTGNEMHKFGFIPININQKSIGAFDLLDVCVGLPGGSRSQLFGDT